MGSPVKGILRKYIAPKDTRRLSFAADVKNPEDDPLPPPEAFIIRRPSFAAGGVAASPEGGSPDAVVPGGPPGAVPGRVQVEIVRDDDGVLGGIFGDDSRAIVPVVMCATLVLILAVAGFIVSLFASSSSKTEKPPEPIVTFNDTNVTMTKVTSAGRHHFGVTRLNMPSENTASGVEEETQWDRSDRLTTVDEDSPDLAEWSDTSTSDGESAGDGKAAARRH
ncbi:uncharacterized protein LOC135400335 [Ornithodoros turicata]|uniref:uncharacterized protein LOC135400335 n=1 Tax=Ornithodoros turicata TaxID=34597 RepID=UPI0031393426